MIPIWKDTQVTATDADNETYPFAIWVRGIKVYNGTAVKNAQDNFLILVNDAIADYLYNNVPTAISTERLQALADVQAYGLVAECSVVHSDTVIWQNQMKYDWSYDESGESVYSAPVNGRIDPRMPLIWTMYASADDTTESATGYARTGDFLYDDYSNDYSSADVKDALEVVVAQGGHNIVMSPGDVSQYQWITAGGNTYKVVTACHRYAFYYINEYGGVDFLLMEGNCTEQDTLTRHTILRNYLSSDRTARGKKEYLNEQVKMMTLRTGYLTTSEAAKMHHLIGSPDVFLWDNVAQEMRPVVITTTAQEYKTYRSEGNRLVQYSIDIEFSQTRQRK